MIWREHVRPVTTSIISELTSDALVSSNYMSSLTAVPSWFDESRVPLNWTIM
jgi:hypothetical protein